MKRSGFAAYQLVKVLRRQSADLSIMVITANSGDDYSKPDLSHVFSRQQTAADLVKMPAEQFSREFNIQLLTNTRVESINTAQKQLVANGQLIEFSKLVLATGASTNIPPIAGDGVADILTLNSLEEYRKAQSVLQGARSVLVIGTEIVMDLATAGRNLVLTDRADSIMASLLPDFVSAQLHGKLLAQGVRTELNTEVRRLNKLADGIEVILANGHRYKVDSVICAAGLKTNSKLAQQAGISANRGIVVNRSLQTSVDGIYALGDCAEIEGQMLPYLQPILLSANVLGRVLTGEPAELSIPATLVKVKTPLLPIQLSGVTSRMGSH